MDCGKVGTLIYRLRKEQGLTQRQLADAVGVSDKAISKWERGLGCPDVTLLRELSRALNVNIGRILAGNLEPNDTDGGNMNRLKFYTCPNCGTILTATGEAEVSCCGRPLSPLVPKPAEGTHRLAVQPVEHDLYLTGSHEMSKEHYLTFVAYVLCDRMLFVRLYPEQSAEVRIPNMYEGRLFFGCSRHGLWVQDL